ncbi:class I SAM-dependent methyltransferase [Desulfovibrio ferrophilus]|uniref:Methyltransferase type 11 n=1 Tax=Desulfovibrio ferrophilus TaxID=241368 RepID=A0A2Z6B0I2_9BACT|nr:methyltransferase domain-containing protein [Desulfovibrio ferrophilus]BBD09011.1 methyltransferase type 11 [Desulfovibrio ferrophilus]
MPRPTDEYATVARLYDPLTGPFLRGIRRAVVSLGLSLKAHDVIDICCGTGAQLIALNNAGFSCTGVDLSLPMLTVARQKSPASIAYIHADATHLPLTDNNYDFAILAFALHEKPGIVREALLTETLRVLKPGGTLAIADYLAPRNLAGRVGHLGVTVFERAAGGEHFLLYQEYLQMGGTLGLLDRLELSGTVTRSFHLGAVGLITLQKQ